MEKIFADQEFKQIITFYGGYFRGSRPIRENRGYYVRPKFGTIWYVFDPPFGVLQLALSSVLTCGPVLDLPCVVYAPSRNICQLLGFNLVVESLRTHL